MVNAISTPVPRRRRARSASYPPDEAGSLRRIRRYAVPRSMIEQATERRLAGDWRGACAAAGVDVAFDLADVADEYGAAVAAELEDDLLNLAPDLLRWHVPRGRYAQTTIRSAQQVVLGGYGDRSTGAPALLHVTTPPSPHAPQRLVLRFGPVRSEDRARRPWLPEDPWLLHDWTLIRELWDARRAGELLARCGGSERAPFFEADGTPRALPAADPGPGDPAGHTEWVTLLHEAGEVEAAFAAAGIHLDASRHRTRWATSTERPGAWPPHARPSAMLERVPFALARLGPEIRRRADRGFGRRFQVPSVHDWRCVLLVEVEDDGGLRAWVVDSEQAEGVPVLPEPCWRRLPDLDALRHGDTEPDHLHPLVRAALFPRRADSGGPIGPPAPAVPAPVRVRCRGEWHVAAFRDGTLQIPHDEDERRRERAMGALGGAVTGCFAVLPVVRSGTGRLPKALRAQRRELFARAEHGDASGVLRLLDAGMDPHIRDGGRRTLLHVLHLLDHERLLSRLLAAGLDIDVRDHYDSTPLHAAVSGDGSPDLVRALLAAGAGIEAVNQDGSTPLLLSVYRSAPVPVVRALLDAGARPDVTDRWGSSIRDHIHRCRRTDLAFLAEALDRDHPGVGHGRWRRS
ncbi:ankyrin repeat domain-containing protein [Actinoallomurus sp. NPDC052308]|uniref:ankyrin repeat domain-containing protein n=1 Tax=Actinoallomurus sp. NPDC052308 TaxID=3155530 RepID=UPI003418A5CC